MTKLLCWKTVRCGVSTRFVIYKANNITKDYFYSNFVTETITKSILFSHVEGNQKENDTKKCLLLLAHLFCLLQEPSRVWEYIFFSSLFLFVIWTKGAAFCTGSNIVCMRYECERKGKCYRLQVCATTLLNRSSHHVRSTTSHFSRSGGKWVLDFFCFRFLKGLCLSEVI